MVDKKIEQAEQGIVEETKTNENGNETETKLASDTEIWTKANKPNVSSAKRAQHNYYLKHKDKKGKKINETKSFKKEDVEVIGPITVSDDDKVNKEVQKSEQEIVTTDKEAKPIKKKMNNNQYIIAIFIILAIIAAIWYFFIRKKD